MSENEFEKKIVAPVEQPLTASTSINKEPVLVHGITGPLVVFFGPRDIGKTVALLRLCSYLDKYSITVDEGFRSDTEQYKKTIEAFNQLRNNMDFAPATTGAVNFLLLDIRHNGNKICQILEAPGEHFFKNEETDDAKFEPYLNQIFNADYRKVYVFFFTINMFNTDGERKRYARKVSKFLQDRVDPKKDRIIILCTKCNESPTYLRNGKPIRENYQNDLYSKSGFESIRNTIKNSGFSSVPFIPFSSGDFNEGGEGNKKIFTLSNNIYPKMFWAELYKSLTGKTSFWTRWFGI